MDVGKFCPNCKLNNDTGALICVHCGASLDISPDEPATTRQVDDYQSFLPAFGKRIAEELSLPPSGVVLYLYGSTTPVATRTDKDFVIGRVVESTPERLVDLSQFDGFAMGVSRRHVMVRQTQTGYEVIDLDSSNGTWLDDQRLVPSRAYPLPNRAMLRLGQLRLIVLYQTPADTSK